MRLINADALIEEHYKYCHEHPDAKIEAWSLELMEDAPEVESLEEYCDRLWEFAYARGRREERRRWKETYNEGYQKGHEDGYNKGVASKWIPCSERLPKETVEVLMLLEWGVDIGEYRDGDWHSEWINHYDDGNVLAWMPLPEPYEG